MKNRTFLLNAAGAAVFGLVSLACGKAWWSSVAIRAVASESILFSIGAFIATTVSAYGAVALGQRAANTVAKGAAGRDAADFPRHDVAEKQAETAAPTLMQYGVADDPLVRYREAGPVHARTSVAEVGAPDDVPTRGM